MTLEESIRSCFNKYADFNGRATRSEYWWFMLFLFLVTGALDMVSRHGVASGLFSLATIIPSFAAGARRLHDTNRSGWWQLLLMVPVIGWIVLLVWEIQVGGAAPNRYDTAQ